MKRIVLVYLLFTCIVGNAQDLVILHTNDMHSHLNGFSPEAEYTPLLNDNDPTEGGFSRIAGFIKAEKAKYGDKLLVVDAGDFLMGTLFQTIELSEGFQLNLMHEMGYEFAAIGNHEFDFGPNALAKIINNSKDNGDIPTLLCANYGGTKLVNDDDLISLFEKEVILPYSITEKNGLKIGLFGLVGIDADESIDSNYGIKWNKQKKVAKATSKYLKKIENVDLVIVLSHSGVSKNKKGNWEGEDFELGKAAPEIDIIISGHSHTYLPKMIKAGHATILQTGALGLNVGRLAITMDENGIPKMDYNLVKMNDAIKADKQTQDLIDSKAKIIEKNILSDYGIAYNDYVGETSFELTMNEHKPLESNLGPFVADAIYHQLNTGEAPGVDAVLVVTGVIRTNIYAGNKGFQNINDIFNIMPLGMGDDVVPGRPLGKIFVKGNELKKVLELIFAVSPSKLDYYLYFSGMKVNYNPEKGLFRKISSIEIGNDATGFKAIDIGRKSNNLVSIAANTYMISFIGNLKKMSFGLVNVIPKTQDGTPIINNDFVVDLNPNKDGIQEAKEWLAIYNYLKTFDDTNGNGVPDIPTEYISKRNPLVSVENKK
ncbi:MAG: metallophosphoesterase [Prolixibacteraceae bacterium]|jgi:5'-nucleotidase/UDP-sugar diphosphatase|nr:metallophosphoesterase [Prolixibacteraceae bacterium]